MNACADTDHQPHHEPSGMQESQYVLKIPHNCSSCWYCCEMDAGWGFLSAHAMPGCAAHLYAVSRDGQHVPALPQQPRDLVKAA